MSELDKLAQNVAGRTRQEMQKAVTRAAYLATAVALVVQTVVLVVVMWVMLHHLQEISQRVDRNLTYTSCVLSVHPDQRLDSDLVRCYEEATDLYPDLEPPLPSPSPRLSGI